MKKILALLFGISLAASLFAIETGSISGIVTDSITGTPIFGALITACQNNVCAGRAITDSTGAYTILNLADGEYNVTARARNYRVKHYPTPVVVSNGQNTPSINFQLAPNISPPPPNPSSISGIVTDSATGLPLESVIVIARSRRFVRRAITNSNGNYTITNLRAGVYRLMAHKRGYLPKHYPEPIILEPGQAISGINFTLVQGNVPPPPPPPPPPGLGSISGTVVNAITQLPIPNATVHAMNVDSIHYGSGMARTNADGTYTIQNLRPGTYTVRASAMGFNMAIYPNPVIVIGNQNTPDINFALTPRQP